MVTTYVVYCSDHGRLAVSLDFAGDPIRPRADADESQEEGERNSTGGRILEGSEPPCRILVIEICAKVLDIVGAPGPLLASSLSFPPPG